MVSNVMAARTAERAGRPAVISDFSPQHPGRVVRAGPHHSVPALGLPHHMVAQLLVQVDVRLSA